MNAIRRVFVAERLSSGNVLVAGGYTGRGILSTAELYDPAAGSWRYTGSMSTSRAGHRSSLSIATKALVTGGTNGTYQSSAEMYNETGGTWSSAGAMSTARAQHGQATLAFDGKVLVAGGTSNGTAMSSSVDIYDPATNSWTAGPSLHAARGNVSAILLHTAQVVVPGGNTGTGYTSSADLWSMYPQRTDATAALAAARARYAATRLLDPNTKMLVAGGYDGTSYLTSSELYDVGSGNTTGSTNPEGWSPPPLTLTWNVENPTGTFASSYTLAATLTNNDTISRSAYIDLTAIGLDDRTVTRSTYFDVTVGAGGSTQLTIAASAFPIEPVGSEAQLILSLRPYVVGTGPTGENWEANSPLFYEFTSDYSQVILHGAIGADLDRTQPAASATQAAWLASTASMRTGLATVTGRVWSPASGGFVDVSTLTPAQHGAHAAYAMRGQWAKDIDTIILADDYVPPGNAKYYVFCSKWAVNYDDAGYGEDLLNIPSIQQPWAAYADYLVAGPNNTLVSFGNLNSTGCTPAMLLGNTDTFQFLWETQMLKTTTTIRVARGPAGMWCDPQPPGGCAVDTFGGYPDWFVHSITTQNDGSSTPGSAPHYDNHTAQQTFCTNAAGVFGLALAQNDSGLLSNQLYSVYANTGCPSIMDQNGVPGEACGGAFLYLGKSFTYDNQQPPKPIANGRHTTFSKHTIGHEFGHMIASGLYGPGVGLGSPTYFQYDCQDSKNLLNCQQGFASAGIPPTTEARCRCDFVNAGNQIHCLQSKQIQPFANNEGWAHFYSSNLFNNPSESNCTFVYYKTALVWDSMLGDFAKKTPPNPTACYLSSPGERWLWDQCPGSKTNKGVEVDWLRHFWEVHNKGTYAYTFDEIGQTFRKACTGSTSLACGASSVFFDEAPGGTTPSEWPNPQSMSLKDAATALFAQSKATYFRDTGVKYGINNL